MAGRVRTQAKSFGTSKRESHDSSALYTSRLYQAGGLSLAGAVTGPGEGKMIEQPLPETARNQVFCGDSRNMEHLPDGSVHLMVTSPPYNVGKDYDKDLSMEEYRDMLRAVFRETYRVLAPGGRACVNVANLGRKPYIPLHAYIIEDMIDVGFRMRGEIIWDKRASAGVSTAWGSWCSASNPTLRDVHEYILVFSKGDFKRPRRERTNTIGKEDFLEYTKSLWSFPAESARRVGHPAPFPVELPWRLIQLYTYQGDVVLDPFCGSGSTCVAALNAGRVYVGYELNPTYVEVANRRLAEASRARAQKAGRSGAAAD
jgi:DNA modification methylase